MAVRLIALDIDGTLLNSRWEVSPANRDAIAEATRRRIHLPPPPPPPHHFPPPVAQQIPSPLTMIVNNGAMVRTKDGHTHVRHLLPQTTASRVLQSTMSWRESTAVVFDRPQANQVMIEKIDWEDPTRGGYYRRNREFMGESQPLEACLNEDPIQVMFTGPVAPMRQVEQTLRNVPFSDAFSLAVTVYEDKDFAMIDVIHPAVSKGAALAEWAGLRGYSPAQILAIGDNHNDLEMLSFAGIPVVMENGVAAAIAHFALREAPKCA